MPKTWYSNSHVCSTQKRSWGCQISIMCTALPMPKLPCLYILSFFCLFVWLVGFLTSSSTTRLYRGWAPRQSVRQFYMLPHTRQSERGDHDLCLSRSHYTDMNSTSRERAATAGVEPRTSSPGVAHSTD